MGAVRHDGVPRFALYGEAEAATDAEFVHIEDIQSRSRRYGWEIRSHSHRGLFQTVFVLDGDGAASLDGQATAMSGPCAVTVPPAVVHDFRFRPETHGYVLTVAESMLFDSAHGMSRPLFERLFVEPRVVALATGAQRIAMLLDHLMEEFRWPRPGRGLMFAWLVQSALLLVERERAATAPASPPDQVRAEVFARFRALVEAHYTEHWPIPRYAEALGVTESRLNRLCRHVAGKSAFDVTQDRLLLEARRKLTYIAAPVTLLAYELGFQDPAYFCRFFKKMTGVSPAVFRKRGPGGPG